MEGSRDVRVDIELRIEDGRAHSCPCRQMNDRVGLDTPEEFMNRLPLTEVNLDTLHGGGKCSGIGPLDDRIIEVVKVIDHRDIMTGIQEFLNHMGSDKTYSPCDNDLHRETLSIFPALMKGRKG